MNFLALNKLLKKLILKTKLVRNIRLKQELSIKKVVTMERLLDVIVYHLVIALFG